MMISASTSSGIEDDFATVDLNVELKGGKKFSFDALRNFSSGLNLHQLAEYHSSISDLDAKPVSYSVSEDSLSNTLSIKASFDNNELFEGHNAYFDYSISFETDALSDITTINLRGEIIGRGHAAQKIANAESFLENTILPSGSSYLYGAILDAYQELGFTYDLSFPKSLSIDKDPLNGNISISTSYTDEDILNDPPSGPDNNLINTSYEVKIKPSLQTFKPFKSLNRNGDYLIYDINSRNRERVDFSITTSYWNLYKDDTSQPNRQEFLEKSSNQAKAPIYKLVENLKGVYLLGANRRIEAESLDVELDPGKISANYSFTQEEQHPTFTDSESKIEL
jgi:hypothetical protein